MNTNKLAIYGFIACLMVFIHAFPQVVRGTALLTGVVLLILAVRSTRIERARARGQVNRDRIQAEEDLHSSRSRLADAEESLRRRDQLRGAVTELSRLALMDGGLDILFQEAAKTVADVLELTCTLVLEFHDDNKHFTPRAGVGWSRELVEVDPIPAVMKNHAGFTLRSSCAVVFEDLATETRFHGSDLLQDRGVVSGVEALIGRQAGRWGVLGAYSSQPRQFTPHETLFMMSVTGVLADAIHTRNTLVERETLIREMACRTRELKCLYGITDTIKNGTDVGDMLVELAAKVPIGWQFPDIAKVKIVLNCEEYRSEPFEESEWVMSSPVHVNNEPAGVIELFYGEERPESDEGPFLASERKLLNTVADELGEMIENMKIRKERHHLITAIEQTNDTIVITGLDGTIQYANPAFENITGYSREEVQGQNPNLLSSGKHDAAFYRDLWKVIGAGEVWSGRFVNKRKDGSLFDEEATISPVRNDSGSVVAYVAVKRDISEQVILESQLSQAQKLESIGQLAAGIAHEINTPTQFVGDNIRFLKDAFQDLRELVKVVSASLARAVDGPISTEEVRLIQEAMKEADMDYLDTEIPQSINQSLEGINRVATIVRAMKEFSHPGDEKTTVDINQAIQSTIIVAKNEWKYAADVETDMDPNMPPVPCIPGEFNQVILNIIVNAAHAIAKVQEDNSDEKGIINVTTRQKGDHAEIRISDTGCGMADEVRKKVFDPFFTTKEVGKGTGQGLSIAQTVIVKKHHGTIEVLSKEGHGATFIIRIPLTEAAENRAEAV